MATTLSFGGSWFSDRQPSTGTPTGLSRAANYVLAATILAGAGTGALVDDLDWWRQNRLNDPLINSSRSPVVGITVTRTPVEDLERIREVLSPSMSDLATTLAVSRQAVYNWLNGEQPKPEHIAKLRDLACAADMLAEADIPVTGALMKRKLMEGKNLFEITQDGGSARDAAQWLVQIVQRELEQREMMAGRFANRKNPRSAESDFPVGNDAR